MNKYQISNEYNFSKQPIQNGDIAIENVTSLTGVYNLDILKSDALNCIFFLFGDLHTLTKGTFHDANNETLYLPLYLDALFKKHSDKQFDFILEVAPYNSDQILQTDNKNSVIDSIVTQFNICYQGIDNKLECSKEWPNVRFHNVDLRVVVNKYSDYEKYTFVHIIQVLTFRFNELDKLMNDLPNDTSKENLDLTFGILENDIENMRTLLENNGKYVFDLIHDDDKFYTYRKLDYMKKINEYIRNYMMLEYAFNKIFTSAKKLKNKKNKVYYEIFCLLGKTKQTTLNLLILFVDYYMLIRIMKILSYGGKNIIILEGENHIKNVKNFIKTIDSDSKFIVGNCEVDDFLYDGLKKLIKSDNNINMPNIRLNLRHANMMCEYWLNKEINSAQVHNMQTLLASYDSVNIDKIIRILSFPSGRIIKIKSSIIENNLI